MQGPRRKTGRNDTFRVEASRDRAFADLAGRQHGVVARRQLAALGFTDTVITRAARLGRLHRIHHGVYAVGHTVLGARGRWMAATLACGRGAVLSHTSAAALWELRPSASAVIHVTVPTAGGRTRRDVRIHRTPSLRPDEVTTHEGIPVTTPERTLLDIAATLTPRQLERALDQAEVLRLIDHPILGVVARTHPNHRGAARLEATRTSHEPGTTLTRSELEETFLELCRSHRLPRPRVNARVARLEVDFLFSAHSVVVETDGWRYHGTRHAFDRDRDRDATLTRAGYRVLRFTHRQVASHPAVVAATLAAAFQSQEGATAAG